MLLLAAYYVAAQAVRPMDMYGHLPLFSVEVLRALLTNTVLSCLALAIKTSIAPHETNAMLNRQVESPS